MCAIRDSLEREGFCNSILSEDRLFQGLAPEVANAFGALKQMGSYPAGSIIFTEGGPPVGAYVLGQGRVKLTVISVKRRSRTVGSAEAGEILGLSATIAGEPYEVTAETLTICEAAFIDRRQFLAFLNHQPEFCFRVVRLLGQHFKDLVERFRRLERNPPAAAKLAHLLLDWAAAREQSSVGIVLRLPLTHEAIGALIGTSRETVTRTLAEFRRQDIICPEDAAILIRNRAELERIANLDR